MQKFFFTLQYLRHPRWDTGLTPPELIEFTRLRQPGRALDLGCGTATNVIYLAQQGWQASGIDFASRAISIGKKKARQAGIQVDLQVADVTRPLPFDQPFDLILDIGCLHSLPASAREGYFSNLFRLLAKDGTYLLYAFTGEDSNQPGLSSQEIDWLSRKLNLIHRQDGSDTASVRHSSWFTFDNLD